MREAVRVIQLLDGVEFVYEIGKDRMNGRKRERGGREYVCFFCNFVFGFKYGEGSEEEVCGWEMPACLFYSLTETKGYVQDVDKQNVMQRQREKIWHSIGQWIKD